MSRSFVSIARDVFAFLEDEYGFLFERQSSYPDGGGQVTYMNVKNGVAVNVSYEYMDAYVCVQICKLVDGKIRDNVYSLTDESSITCFDFAEVLPVSERMNPSYMYDKSSKYFDKKNGLREFVDEFATRLRKYGKDLLSGDFSVLPGVRRAIMQRFQEQNRSRLDSNRN